MFRFMEHAFCPLLEGQHMCVQFAGWRCVICPQYFKVNEESPYYFCSIHAAARGIRPKHGTVPIARPGTPARAAVDLVHHTGLTPTCPPFPPAVTPALTPAGTIVAPAVTPACTAVTPAVSPALTAVTPSPSTAFVFLPTN